MMDWVNIAILALRLVAQFTDWVEREKVTEDAQRKLIDDARNEIDASIRTAQNARGRVAADLAAHPDELRQPDGNLRPD